MINKNKYKSYVAYRIRYVVVNHLLSLRCLNAFLCQLCFKEDPAILLGQIKQAFHFLLRKDRRRNFFAVHCDAVRILDKFSMCLFFQRWRCKALKKKGFSIDDPFSVVNQVIL